ILRGYSDLNRTNLVAESRPVLLGSMPTTIDNPIEITSSTSAIRIAVLSLVLFQDQTMSPDSQPVVVDNFEYGAPRIPLPADTTPPVVHILRPLEFQTIQGLTPGVVSTPSDVEIDEAALRSVTAVLNTHAPVNLSYAQVTPGLYHARQDLSDAEGL